MKKLLPLFACIISLVGYSQIQLGLDIDGEDPNSQSGYSVSMPDAYTVAIGARYNYGNGPQSGHVRIYSWSGTAWVQKGIDIDGEAAFDQFGNSVSMPDSNTVAIGAHTNDEAGSNAGHVRIYTWTGTAWTQKGSDIDGEAASDLSGFSVSMPDSNTVAIGATGNAGNGTDAGHVRIYTWTGTAWVQKGSDIDGEAVNDESGCSVSMPDPNTVAIGARFNDGNGPQSGHVRIYSWTGTAWVQKGSDLDGEADGDESGCSVSMPDANTISIGGRNNDGNGTKSGHVRVYQWNGSAWTQKGGDIDGEVYDDQSGYSVSMPNPNIVAIGAPGNDGNGISSGHTRIYEWTGNVWVQKGIDIDGEAVGDQSGRFVSMPDDSTLAIGAYLNDGTANNAGHVRIYYLCPSDSTHEITTCGSYTWNGVTYTSSNNTATDTITNQAGCVSIVTLDLTINNATTGSETVTSCDSYTWIDGNTYTTSNNTAMYTLTNAAGCDSVVTLNLTINSSSSSSITQTACNSLVSPSGNYTWTSSGTYLDTITNAAGCDSVITVDLTINSVSDISTTTSDTTIAANNAGASYRWLDCDENYALIEGETEQSFTPTSNGNYAVELTENGCVDTSDCVAITTIGIIETSFGHKLTVFPNPSDGNFTIDLGNTYPTTQVSITDVAGRLVDSKKVSDSRMLHLSIDEPTGIYMISIQAGEKSAVVRLIKE